MKAAALPGRIRGNVLVDDNGCWIWQRRRDRHGYGRISTSEGKAAKAHRVVYETFVGPIPDGLQLDHLCRVRHCVNPDHLEPVTRRVNLLRDMSPHCLRGHAYDETNTYHPPSRPGARGCITCRRAAKRRRPR